STVLGLLTASALVMILYHFEAIEKGWRWLYIGGAITALFGVILRYFAPITDLKPLGFKKGFFDFYHRLKGFWEMRLIILMITFAAGFSYCSYSVAFSLMTGLVP